MFLLLYFLGREFPNDCLHSGGWISFEGSGGAEGEVPAVSVGWLGAGLALVPAVFVGDGFFWAQDFGDGDGKDSATVTFDRPVHVCQDSFVATCACDPDGLDGLAFLFHVLVADNPLILFFCYCLCAGAPPGFPSGWVVAAVPMTIVFQR